MVHLPAALPMRIELVLGIHQLDVGKKEQERSGLLQHVDIGLGAILDRFDQNIPDVLSKQKVRC